MITALGFTNLPFCFHSDTPAIFFSAQPPAACFINTHLTVSLPCLKLFCGSPWLSGWRPRSSVTRPYLDEPCMSFSVNCHFPSLVPSRWSLFWVWISLSSSSATSARNVPPYPALLPADSPPSMRPQLMQLLWGGDQVRFLLPCAFLMSWTLPLQQLRTCN